MSDVSLHQFLVLYTWFPLAALLLITLLIARTYQKFSNSKTYFWLYILVGILFGAMAVRYASVGLVAQDVITDILAFTAGLLLMFLSIKLYLYMMANDPNHD